MHGQLAMAALAIAVLGPVLTVAEAVLGRPSVPVEVEVDLASPTTPFPHYWSRSFGSGHARLSLRKDWQAHLKQAVDDLGLGGVRYHGIFDDDMGPVVTGNPCLVIRRPPL